MHRSSFDTLWSKPLVMQFLIIFDTYEAHYLPSEHCFKNPSFPEILPVAGLRSEMRAVGLVTTSWT